MFRFRSLLLAAVVALFALAADAATVTTIAVNAGVVTVTTSGAHGFVAGQGVCLTNTAACTALATVPTGTTMTFTQPSNVTVAACASSCGTVTASPRVIVLDMQQPNQAQQIVHYLLWLTTGSPIPQAVTSSWKTGAGSVGATGAQNNAIAAGNFIELNLAQTFPSSSTITEMQTFLQKDYTTRQSALAANTQPGTYYGSIWDGAAWGLQ